MKVVAGLTWLLVNVHLSYACSGEGDILFCSSIPQAFPPGFSIVLVSVKNIGEISATMFQSENLTSVTRLRMEGAGVTGIAEGAFSSFRSLTNLSLTQNLLTEFNPKWFSQPEVLSELYLTENRIQALNDVMLHGLSGLTKLSLNKNSIKTIDVNSFSTQTALAQLDLSDNKMTQVSPQVFRFLKTTKFRLHRNPWDCSCGAENFVNFLKDLQDKSLLEDPAEVKCESPVSVRGRPVWNVSACETSTAPGPAQPKPTGVLTSFPTSSGTMLSVTTLSSQARTEAHPSVQPIATDAATETSSHTETLTSRSSPTVGTEFSVHPKPSDLPVHHTHLPTGLTEAAAQPPGSNIVCTLVAVIVVLSLLLILVCSLVVLHRRNRSNETVKPECSKENRDELKEDGSRSSHVQSPEHAEEGNNWDSELGWGRWFTGVRAKSANAVLFTSPFFLTGKDKVAETKQQSNNTGNPLQGEQQLENQTEVNAGFETDRLRQTTDGSDGEVADGVCQDKGNSCVVVNADIAYLSIGANQNQPEEFINQATNRAAHSLQMGKMLVRISTWPPTAVQWQARCKMMEVSGEEEKEESGPVWAAMFSTGMNKGLSPVRDPPEDLLKRNAVQCSRPKNKDDEEAQDQAEVNQEEQVKEKEEGEMIQDPDTARQTINGSQGLREENHGPEKQIQPAEKRTTKTEPPVTSRQQTRSRSTGSKAPSGGTSPDDETLLSGNEYAFMDLLHEVAQNNGRWTRERWRQRHANKQRR